MIVVVADSGPIRYLAVLGVTEALPQLFDRVILPRSVLAELSHPNAPVESRTWAKNLPTWAEVKEAKQVELAQILDAGEAEAIALAEELHANLVLLDEREGRRIAAARGVLVTGTIGILEKAAALNLLDLAEVLQRLCATSFRITQVAIDDALARDASRRELLRAAQQRSHLESEEEAGSGSETRS